MLIKFNRRPEGGGQRSMSTFPLNTPLKLMISVTQIIMKMRKVNFIQI